MVLPGDFFRPDYFYQFGTGFSGAANGKGWDFPVSRLSSGSAKKAAIHSSAGGRHVSIVVQRRALAGKVIGGNVVGFRETKPFFLAGAWITLYAPPSCRQIAFFRCD